MSDSAVTGTPIPALTEADLSRIAEAVAARLISATSPERRGALLTKAEAADYLGATVRTVQHMITTGQIAAVHLGRAVRIRRSDLDRAIANGTARTDKPQRYAR